MIEFIVWILLKCIVQQLMIYGTKGMITSCQIIIEFPTLLSACRSLWKGIGGRDGHIPLKGPIVGVTVIIVQTCIRIRP